MEKRVGIFFLVLALAFSSLISAESIDGPIKEITYQAEQYETGNINYAQLTVYINSLSREIAEEMGATTQDHDPILKEEQLKNSLGEPTESTKWVWIEGNDGGHDKKLDSEVPAWRKIIFDGNKIQIWLNAWPNIKVSSGEDVLIYKLHTEIFFKAPEDKINVESKISDVKLIAEEYAGAPSEDILERLAKESVSFEKSFENYYRQNPAQCQELMDGIFGSENKRDNQKKLGQEISFAEGDNYEAILRVEMCDDCEWKWIDVHMKFEGRGNFRYPQDNNFGGDKGKYSGLSNEGFKEEATRLVNDAKSAIDAGNYESAMRMMQDLKMLNEAWNEKSNNVWEEMDKLYRVDFESMTEEERRKCSEEYCWIKKDQERRIAERQLRNQNYQDRKSFYLNLFSGYEKKEYYVEEEQWEKRLVEKFKEFGEEICTNNIDDNKNEQIDCAEAQCGGKVCGFDFMNVTRNNETFEEKIQLYCIAGSCQAKEETMQVEMAVCGNHICEENETEICAEDCAACPVYEAIECAGSVIFSGENVTSGCPLEPICLSENTACAADSDCADPLCGDASCIEGTCQVAEITECREAECIDGEEKVQNCDSGESKVVSVCIEGLWTETGVECELISGNESEIEIEEIEQKEIFGNECVVRSDCGNENDVCSNGRCVALPQVIEDAEQETTGEERIETNDDIEESSQDTNNEIEQEIVEEPETEESEPQEESTPEPEEQNDEPITGNIIRNLKVGTKTIVGFVISGFDVEGGESGDSGGESSGEDGSSSSESTGESGEQSRDDSGSQGSGESNEGSQEGERQEGEFNEGNRENEGSFEDNSGWENNERDEDDRREEDRERREAECGERCTRECSERIIRPCTEKCIRETCGEELECNVDEARVTCESTCKENSDLNSCTNECSEKCLGGQDTWVEPEREEHKEERFVFTVGGACRKEQGRTNGNIWFGGWGDEFRDFHQIKNKYYNYGNDNWCKDSLESLIKERKELEKSLNNEFAAWFFEKYVANSATDYEKHMEGIFQLYWKDIEISKQMNERMKCLGQDALPEYSLINFKYDTDFGSVEFWEEVKRVKMDESGEERDVISPYMKIWLFPSRDFFKAKMREAMEKHVIPGENPDEEKFSEDEKQRLREDERFMESVREFNNKYGENLVIQFKDFETEEIVFNVHVRINEEELIYFEPMPAAENPAENVKVEIDVNKLLDIIEYQESGRIELESPPWDRQPRTTFVKGAVDGVKMYFMFNSLMDSTVFAPSDSENSAEIFVDTFFKVVMGDGEGPQGPPEGEDMREQGREGEEGSKQNNEENNF